MLTIMIDSVHVESMTVRMSCGEGQIATLQSGSPTLPHVRGQLLGLLESVTNGFVSTGKRTGDIPDSQLALYFEFEFSGNAQIAMAEAIAKRTGLSYITNLSDIIDNWNGNSKQSQALALTVTAILLGKQSLTETPISNMIKMVHNKEIKWDTSKQGVRIYAGEVEGIKCEFNICHSLGNFFIEGNIGVIKLRIFVTSVIQIFTSYPHMEVEYRDKADVEINREDQAKFAETMNSLLDWSIRDKVANAKS